MLITLAATAPRAMPRLARMASQVGSAAENWVVGMSLGPHLVTATVASAAPMISSTTQDTKTPRPAARPVRSRLVVRGR